MTFFTLEVQLREGGSMALDMHDIGKFFFKKLDLVGQFSI